MQENSCTEGTAKFGDHEGPKITLRNILHILKLKRSVGIFNRKSIAEEIVQTLTRTHCTVEKQRHKIG